MELLANSTGIRVHVDHSKEDVCGAGFKHLTPVHEAVRIVVNHLSQKITGLEMLPLSEVLGRVIAEDVVSLVHIPPFNRAAMDGYAVFAEDTLGASTTAPVPLKLTGSIAIGVVPKIRLNRGEALAVVTGGQIPEGANAVAMIEFTKSSESIVEVSTELHPNENVSCIGEDVTKGSVILRKGTRILPQDIGMLTCLGFDRISVLRRPRVAILSTGNELQKESALVPGKIPDVNRPVLINAVKDYGCEPVDLGIVPDDYNTIRNRIGDGLKVGDVVLVTAGTSVGPGDIVPKVVDSLGSPGMLVHGVAMRPSMPVGLAVINGKLILSLPGYPVSAYLAFLEFFPTLVSRLLGSDFMPRPKVKAKLSRRIAGILGSKTYVRVRVNETDHGLIADPVRTSGAGILSSLVQANGFIIIPEQVEGYEESEFVDVELFRPMERL
jgi:molybdenum cofactor synthesis domain-containing protein